MVENNIGDRFSERNISRLMEEAISDNIYILERGLIETTPVDTGHLINSLHVSGMYIGLSADYAEDVNKVGIHEGYFQRGIERNWDEFVYNVREQVKDSI